MSTLFMRTLFYSIYSLSKVENVMAYAESGLPGTLFSLLDLEEDKQVSARYLAFFGIRLDVHLHLPDIGYPKNEVMVCKLE